MKTYFEIVDKFKFAYLLAVIPLSVNKTDKMYLILFVYVKNYIKVDWLVILCLEVLSVYSNINKIRMCLFLQ